MYSIIIIIQIESISTSSSSHHIIKKKKKKVCFVVWLNQYTYQIGKIETIKNKSKQILNYKYPIETLKRINDDLCVNVIYPQTQSFTPI